jgi:hypothetical protein
MIPKASCAAIVLVVAALVSACTRAPLFIRDLDAQEIQRVSDDDLCRASSTFQETRGRTYPNIDNEIARRKLPCGAISGAPAEPAVEPAAADPAPAPGATARAFRNVNMRAGPGTHHRVVALLRGGEQVTVLGVVDGWCECVSSNGAKVFVSCAYLSEPAVGWASLGRRGPLNPPATAPVGSSRWDARIVFTPRGEPIFGNSASCLGACFEETIRRHGASPQVVAFTRALGGDAYATHYREFGQVDMVTVSQPQYEAGSIYLVNGTPDMIEGDRYELTPRDRQAPAIRSILSRRPNAEVWPYGGLLRHERTSGGGQRFFFEAPLMECRACEPLAMVHYVIEFDAGGRHVNTAFVRTGPVPPR